MALTADQTVFFEQRLGTPLDTDLEDRLTRLGGVGYEAAAVVEILRIRYANLQKNPLQFSVPGDYSENRTENAKMLAAALAEAEDEAGVGDSLLSAYPPPRRWGR